MTEGPDPRANFAVDLAELEACARTSVPAIAAAATRCADGLAADGGPLVGPGASGATAAWAGAHARVVDELLARQRRGVAAIEATGRALDEIATVYRRADGG